MKNKIKRDWNATIFTAIVSLCVFVAISAASFATANTEMEFNHYTGEWVEKVDKEYIECLKNNLSSAHTVEALNLLIAICKADD